MLLLPLMVWRLRNTFPKSVSSVLWRGLARDKDNERGKREREFQDVFEIVGGSPVQRARGRFAG